jgi:hypothetical protein
MAHTIADSPIVATAAVNNVQYVDLTVRIFVHSEARTLTPIRP